MSLKRWKLLKTEEEFKTKFFSIEKRTYKLPNGKIVDDYYHINRPNYVLVVAVNSKNEILIERTYRRGINDFVVEIPAGWIDTDESPIEAAIRELKEETGYCGEAKLLGEIYTQGGYMDQKAYVVKVTVDELNINQPKPEDDEDIEFDFLSMDEINKLIVENKAKDMGMLSAIAIYDRIKI